MVRSIALEFSIDAAEQLAKFHREVTRADMFILSRRWRMLLIAGLLPLGAWIGWDLLRSQREKHIADGIRASMEQVLHAIHVYEEAAGTWPPHTKYARDGRAMSSWRFLLVPFLDINWQKYDLNFSRAWDDAENGKFAQSFGPHVFNIVDERATNILGVVGAGTAFDRHSRRASQDLPDDLVIAIDAADSDTHWMAPGDYDVAELTAAQGRVGDAIRGVLPDRVFLLFADAETWSISADAPMSALAPLLTIDQAAVHDRDQLLGPHRID